MSSAAFAACGNHSGEGERCSGRYRKVLGFVTGMAFTFASESRSLSGRNAVRLPTGTAFGIDRIHHCGRSRKLRNHVLELTPGQRIFPFLTVGVNSMSRTSRRHRKS
jgi:hypothetical protein